MSDTVPAILLGIGLLLSLSAFSWLTATRRPRLSALDCIRVLSDEMTNDELLDASNELYRLYHERQDGAR